jgi:mRNA interferase HicA
MRMKYSEFRRWLKAQGVEFQTGKGSHFKVSLNGKSTVFPDHGAKEIGEGLRKSIIKQLGLKD